MPKVFPCKIKYDKIKCNLIKLNFIESDELIKRTSDKKKENKNRKS